MAGIYSTLGLCPERINLRTGEREWLYCGSWHNEGYMDMHGPDTLLDNDWVPGDEYD